MLKPRKLDKLVEWKDSSSTFAGISSSKKSIESSLGLVRLPIGLPGVKSAFFEADVIPGGCPGLIPLCSLIRMKAIIACGILDHRDGLLVLQITAKNGHRYTTCQQLLHTDSGHYLLTIDGFGTKVDKDSKALGRAIRQQVKLPSGMTKYNNRHLTLVVSDLDNSNINPATAAAAT